MLIMFMNNTMCVVYRKELNLTSSPKKPIPVVISIDNVLKPVEKQRNALCHHGSTMSTPMYVMPISEKNLIVYFY